MVSPNAPTHAHSACGWLLTRGPLTRAPLPAAPAAWRSGSARWRAMHVLHCSRVGEASAKVLNHSKCTCVRPAVPRQPTRPPAAAAAAAAAAARCGMGSRSDSLAARTCLPVNRLRLGCKPLPPCVDSSRYGVRCGAPDRRRRRWRFGRPSGALRRHVRPDRGCKQAPGGRRRPAPERIAADVCPRPSPLHGCRPVCQLATYS